MWEITNLNQFLKYNKIKKFAYDGCHKIYTLKNEEEEKDAEKLNYSIYSIDKIEEIFENSDCPLKFVREWDLKGFVFINQED